MSFGVGNEWPLGIILFIVHWYGMILSELSHRSNECYIDLNVTEHCIFFLIYLPNLVSMYAFNFIIFIFCVCTSISWWWASKSGIAMWQLMWNFLLFVFCTLIYVHANLLVMCCKAKLIAYLRCIFLFWHFSLFVSFCSNFGEFFQIVEKGKCLKFSHQPIGYVLAQLFIMWNNDLVFHIVFAICNSLVWFYWVQIKQILTFFSVIYTLFN